MSEPSFLQKLQHLGQDLAAAAEDGAQPVTEDQYWTRIRVCDPCEHRREGNCGLCGCTITLKAGLRGWTCPDKRWPAIVDRED